MCKKANKKKNMRDIINYVKVVILKINRINGWKRK